MSKAARRFIGFRIDIETRSGEDLKKSGVYRYAEDPDFAVLLIAYCPIYRYPGGAQKLGAVRLLNFNDAAEVARFTDVINDPRFQKHAFNAAFERVCLSMWSGLPGGTFIDPENWRCSSVQASVNGVGGSLDEVARALRSPVRKDTEGKRLIRLFCSKDKKADRFHDGYAPKCWCGADHRDDMAKFADYCDNDVVTEAMVSRLLAPVPEDTQSEYEADQRINDRGVRHFAGLSKQAVAAVTIEQARLMAELKTLTGLANPNSIQQFKGWLEDQGYPMTSLDKAHRAEALADPFIPEAVAEALVLKGEASLTSVSKHKAALATRCADGRIRGSLAFYGAHTGREAGRGIQPQNLPRYEAPAEHRKALILGTVNTLTGVNPAEVAKGTVRASLVPAKGHVFVVPDYNAIEARVLGWLCGETWVEEEFTTGQGKIYEATASTMFGVDKDQLIEDLRRCGKCGKHGCLPCELRARGKVSNLALGYAGGAGALVTMGAEAAGIDIGNYKELNAEWKAAGMPGKFHEWEHDRHDYPELLRLRDLYREASPKTARFWKLCAKAWDISALRGQTVAFGSNNVLMMARDGRHNRMILPSGRSIWYRGARAHVNPDNPDRVERRTFMGKGSGVGHVRTDTHGGKLTENVTQAVARDVLFDLIMKIEDKTRAGWPGRVVLHVHDEVVLEVPKRDAQQVLDDTLGLMAVPPDWAPGLAVQGAGGIMERYGK